MARQYSGYLVVAFYPSVPLNATSLNITYTRTSGGLANGNGEYLQDFSCSPALNFGPTIASATTSSDGSQIIVTTTGSVQNDPFASSASFWRVTSGGSVTVSSASKSGSTVTLNLATPIVGGQTTTVRFIGAGSGSTQVPLRFWSASSSTNYAVTNVAPWPTPTITALDTTTGPSAGGTTVILTGTNFNNVTSVSIGGVPAASFTVDSATQITAVTGPVVSATLVGHVVVGTTHGETGTAATDFTYVRPVVLPNPTFTGLSAKAAEPGRNLIISGTSLAGAIVRVNGVPAQVISATDSAVEFTVPAATTLGNATIEIVAASGTLSIEKAFDVVETITPPVVIMPEPKATRTAYIGKFAGTLKTLSAGQKLATNALAKKLTGGTAVCTGLIQGNPTAQSRALAKARAIAVCASLKSARKTISVQVNTAKDNVKLTQARVRVTY